MRNWEDIYNLSPGYLFSFKENGKITRINAALLAGLGYDKDDVVDVLKIDELLTAGSRIFFQTHLFPLIKMQGSAKELYFLLKGKDGARLPALLNVIVEKQHDTFEVHCAGMEISNRNQFEKELNEAKNTAERALLENKELIKLKKDLELNQHLLEKQLQQATRFHYEHFQISKVLSHDLQEPLRKIVLFISLIEQELSVDHHAYPHFIKIKSFTSRVRNLINSMQKFNSLDYKELTYNDVDLNLILKAAESKLDCVNTKVNYLSNETFRLKADAELLTNFFEELFNNSIKYKQPATDLEITITIDNVLNNIFKHTENRYKYENFIRVIFADNGSGFDNHYSKQIFELFKKLHENDGLGIGLSYCKKIIDMHHGSITVSSAPNEGTRFTILLPVEPVYNIGNSLENRLTEDAISR